MGKIHTLKEVLEIAETARNAGKTIVATNGCFDIIHIGHVRNLEAAKALGDLLIVGINSDASVRIGKGYSRPIVSEQERAEVIASLKAVDYVFIFNERTPFSWISELRPDIHTKGGGEDIVSHPDFAKQKDVVEAGGGTLVLTPHHGGHSTTSIVEKILRSTT